MGVAVGVLWNENNHLVAVEFIKSSFIQPEPASDQVKKIILEECSVMKVQYVLTIIVSITTAFVYLPIFESAEDLIFVIKLIREYYSSWMTLIYVFYFWAYVAIIYTVICTIFTIRYLAKHMIFQFYILNDCVKMMHRNNHVEDENLYYNVHFQDEVTNKMIFCIKTYATLKELV
jgi:hypothetical protein